MFSINYLAISCLFCDEFISLQDKISGPPPPLYRYTVKIANFRQILMSSLKVFSVFPQCPNVKMPNFGCKVTDR